MQPGRRAQRDRRRELHTADAAQLLDLLLLQPPLAAHGQLALDLLQGRVLQGADQVLHVAELPRRAGSRHHEQARGLEIPGQGGVRAADQDRGTDHGDVQAGVRTRGPAAEALDLQQVADAGGLGGRPQLGVLGQRDVVVRQGPVDHRRGAEHDPVHARRGGRGEDGLGPAHVVRRTGSRVGLQIQVEGEVDHDVRAAQLLGDRGVPYVQDVPLRGRTVPAPLVDGDDLLDLVGGGQAAHQGRADTRRCAGHGDHGASHGRVSRLANALGAVTVVGAVFVVGRRAKLRIWGTHRASPAVVFSRDAP